MGAHRSRAWWMQAVSEWQNSGMDARRFCAEHGLSRASLYRWRRELEAGACAPGPAMALLRVEVAEPAVVVAPQTWTALVGPAELRFAVGTEAGYIAQVVAAIAQAVGRC